MTTAEILPVNFTISDEAKRALDDLRQRFDQSFPTDPAVVPSIGWGYVLGTSPDEGNVAIGFYRRSEEAAVAAAIQVSSGVRLVFFTTPEHHLRFAGKMLDHTAEHGFFLREGAE